MNNWIKVEDKLSNPEKSNQEYEVIGFHPEWICEDFNPNGTRVCYFDDVGWHWARYNNSMDMWVTVDEEVATGVAAGSAPILWTPVPKMPKMCPKCGSFDVIYFHSDLDLCKGCNKLIDL